MKGKRKLKSPNRLLLIRHQVEARSLLAKRSKKNANRFLDAISAFLMDHEPAGRLAGGDYKSTPDADPQ